MIRPLLSIAFLFVFTFLLPAQGSWVKKADYPGCFTHSQIAFSVAGKGYVGLGASSCIDMWEYDPQTNMWTQKGDFPGAGTSNRPVSFAIGDKGYVCLGDNGAGNYTNELWEYDHQNDSWQQRTPFPGHGRGVAVCFVIDDKGYVGTGEYFDDQGHHVLKDFWAYDPSNDQWMQVADMPLPLVAAVAFSAAGKGYVGSGANDDTPLFNDFYAYDPVADSWTQIQSLPRSPTALATAFSIGNQGYFGMGLDDAQQFFEYNPYSGEWVQKADYPDTKAWDEGIGFSIGDKGYMGLGDNITGFPAPINRSFYEYTPDSILTSGVNDVALCDRAVMIYPNPTQDHDLVALKWRSAQDAGAVRIDVLDMQGKVIKTLRHTHSSGPATLSVGDLHPGMYVVRIHSGSHSGHGKLIKM